MGAISRGVRNAFRNSVRTVSIVFILAVSISMALIMLMSLKTVQSKIDAVKGSIGNYITVAPAGIRGFEGGGELLTEADATSIGGIAHVSKVIKAMSDRLTPTTDTSLQSAIEPGSFGNRQRKVDDNSSANPPSDVPPEGSTSSRGESTSSGNGTQRSFTMPVTVAATSDLLALASLNVSQFNITSGQSFATDTTENVALVGKTLATKNNLSVGSVFQAYSKDITVVGIFDSGNTFTDASLVMPMATLQTLSSQTGQISSLIVQTDGIDSVSSVQSEIKSKLGTKADATSQQDSSQAALTPLENIKNISLYSLIGSLVAGAIIIFLTMVMIVRERRREIGVLKAIGASNTLVMAQFTVESLVLTLMSSVIGMILGLLLANPVLKVLVNNSSSTESVASRGGPGGGMMMRLGSAGVDSIRNLQAVVGWQIILYGLGAAVIIAIIGSAIPSFIIAKVRPAEVMRAE